MLGLMKLINRGSLLKVYSVRLLELLMRLSFPRKNWSFRVGRLAES